MKIKSLFAPALAGFVLVSTARASSFAGSVVAYSPGTGISPGYTNTGVVVGQPSTADAYGDAVDPFDPAYATNQILALGTNGSLTVKFAQPIISGVPGNPYGLDFMIFGDSFFIVTNATDSNYNYIGTPATGGTVYADTCQATVWVSSDGMTFYKLNPALVPQLNYLYPTDGGGDFQIPVNPALTATNFAGLNLAQVRTLYGGSAGGAGYAISWAQDTNGHSVSLFEISYIRVEVQSGEALIAGFASVANPNQVMAEDFSHNPALDGWQVFGSGSLFAWNSTNQNLQVTWNSASNNSYFYHPLGTILGTNDNFSVSFNLYLTDYAAGGYSFPVTAGMQNFAEAGNPDFLIGSGDNSTNLAEFEFFPATANIPNASVDPTFIDSENDFAYNTYGYAALPTGVAMRVTLSYTATNLTGVLTITTNGVAVAAPSYAYLTNDTYGIFGDFRLDTFAVESYSGVASDSSLLAHGTIGNVLIVTPPPPVTGLQAALAHGVGQVQFSGQAHWNYVLQSSTNLQSWAAAGPVVNGTNGTMTLQDTGAVRPHQFYRVNAQKAD
jgi:hypothetical protein